MMSRGMASNAELYKLVIDSESDISAVAAFVLITYLRNGKDISHCR
jgi:hypothetical protein